MGAPFSTAKSYITAVMLTTPAPELAPRSDRVITRSMAAALEQANIKDPGHELGDDLLCEIFKFLSSKDLVACLAVCRHWQHIADDPRLWQTLCQELWRGKAYVPCSIISMAPRPAYAASLSDSRRVDITMDELCSMTWEFSFKQSWLGYHDLPPMMRQFHKDGTFSTGLDDPWSDVQYRWRFKGKREGKRGVFVQVHSFPALVTHRTDNWGWWMENMFVILRATSELPRTCPCCISDTPAG